MNVTTGKHGTQVVLTVGVYGVLFVLGAVEGVIGSFQYSRTAGSVPLAAIAFCAAILATCLLAAWGMRSVSGALMPAVGLDHRVVRAVHAGLERQHHHHEYDAGQVVPVRRDGERSSRGGRLVRRLDQGEAALGSLR